MRPWSRFAAREPLTQARSTEVVAKSNYFKARAALDRAIGASLERNNITFEEAYHVKVVRPPSPVPVLEPK